jgi:hypothetical protein
VTNNDVLMRVEIDTSQHPHYGKTCGICNQPMRVGQDALVYDAGRGMYVRRETIWHRDCMRIFLEREWPRTPKSRPQRRHGAGEVDKAIERLRAKGSRVPALLCD